MRASGYSAWRILAPAGVLTLLAGVLGAAVLNPLSAAANARFESLRDAYVDARAGQAAPTAVVWLREATPGGFIVIGASDIDPDASTLRDPVFRYYDEGGEGIPRLERTVMAVSAELRSGFWVLSGAMEAQPGDPRVDRRRVPAHAHWRAGPVRARPLAGRGVILAPAIGDRVRARGRIVQPAV